MVIASQGASTFAYGMIYSNGIKTEARALAIMSMPKCGVDNEYEKFLLTFCSQPESHRNGCYGLLNKQVLLNGSGIEECRHELTRMSGDNSIELDNTMSGFR